MMMDIARIVVYLMVMLGLYACSGSGSNTSADGTKIGYYTIGENGGIASPWGDASATHRPAMAVKFTPSFYPVTITSVNVYVLNNSGSDQLFNIYGFSDTLSAEVNIFSPVQNQTIPATGTLCMKRSINIPVTTISSGSFHIAVEWITKPLSSLSGANSFFICTDSALNYANTSYFRFTGTTWQSLETISSTGGDLGILVNY